MKKQNAPAHMAAGAQSMFNPGGSSTATPLEKIQSVLFVHSIVDDFGLTPAESRILMRVTRRGGNDGWCCESVDNMATGCLMNPKTIRKALQRLVAYGVLLRDKRPHQTWLYRIAPLADWIAASDLKRAQPSQSDTGPNSQKSIGGDSQKNIDRGYQNEPGGDSQTDTDKGDPLQGNPCKEIPLKELQTNDNNCAPALEAERSASSLPAPPIPSEEEILSYARDNGICPDLCKAFLKIMSRAKRYWHDGKGQIIGWQSLLQDAQNAAVAVASPETSPFNLYLGLVVERISGPSSKPKQPASKPVNSITSGTLYDDPDSPF